MKIDHIGVAVVSIEGAAAFSRRLGMDVGLVEEVAEQKVRAAMIPVGESRVELLETTDPDGPIGKFLARKGGGLHHIAIEVEGLEETLKNLQEQGFELIDREPKKGAHGRKVAFIHPRSTGGVLLELCEADR